MHEALRTALEPVLHDLSEFGITLPRIEDTDWAADSRYTSAMLWSRDGTGCGVVVGLCFPEAVRVAAVADQVQRWTTEDPSATTQGSWPPCPHHPLGHPLAAAVQNGKAMWLCQIGRPAIAPVGDLTSTPTGVARRSSPGSAAQSPAPDASADSIDPRVAPATAPPHDAPSPRAAERPW